MKWTAHNVRLTNVRLTNVRRVWRDETNNHRKPRFVSLRNWQPHTPSAMTHPDPTISYRYPDLPTCVFSDTQLDRLNNLRHSHSLLSAALPPKSLYLLFSQNLHILLSNSRLSLLSPHHLPPQISSNPHPFLFLGVSHHIAYHAIRLPHSFDTTTYLADNPNSKFLHLRSALPHLPHHHAALVAHARSLFEFHQRHQFCGVCASPTLSDHAGARRRCTRNTRPDQPHTLNSDSQSCNGVWFPRSDPVVIMLVLSPCQQRVLLARSSNHPKSFYSCLAGFMEHAEGIEQAVRREVFEEAAIKVSRVRFFASQPWPFPYSLMLGCIALAETTDIRLDERELEDARWFDRTQLVDMVRRGRSQNPNLSSELAVPPPTAIAGMMCAAYAESNSIASFPPSPSSPSSGML